MLGGSGASAAGAPALEAAAKLVVVKLVKLVTPGAAAAATVLAADCSLPSRGSCGTRASGCGARAGGGLSAASVRLGNSRTTAAARARV